MPEAETKYRWETFRDPARDIEYLVLSKMQSGRRYVFTSRYGWLDTSYGVPSNHEFPYVTGEDAADRGLLARKMADLKSTVERSVWGGETFAGQFYQLWIAELDRRGTRQMVVGW